MNPLKNIKVRKLDHTSFGHKLLKIMLILLSLFLLFVIVMNVLINYILPVEGTSTHGVSNGLYYELAIDKNRYEPGEPIRLRLFVKNTSPKAILLKFPTSQKYDFVVKHDLDFLFFHFPIDVWQSSYHIIPNQNPTTLNLAPGASKIFQDVWNQKDAKGEQVMPGRYVIEAYLTTTGQKTILELPARMQK